MDRNKFGEIYYLFSREAAEKDAIQNYVETHLKPLRKARQQLLFPMGGYQRVDESFLQKLDEGREELARSFKDKNSHLGSEELTELTQRTLDRLVFTRFLEDKLIEPKPIVENFSRGGSTWKGFIATSARLNRVYNGVVFKRHEILDSPEFEPDEQVFDSICESFSHANSPYDFNAIPIHILGSIYERFLGKTIIATKKSAILEEKPEVRKAGGVYYTPEYIVRCIVENTVGKQIKGKKPDEVRQMRFADIACGSGSFLLGIYDLLLRHYTAYYNSNETRRKEGRNAKCREHDDGTLHLSLWQRREILLNNIYGVDIDSQAVEVAQLSLYLKMLEDETAVSTRGYQLELREALLPSLSNNIVCGNSLIGWGILDGLLFDSAEERKLNPLSFDDAFPQVMKAGGFDAVIGNPPYVRTERLDKRQLDYFKKNYSAEGQIDLYVLFIQRALRLLKKDGYFGFITPKFLLFNLDTEPTRKRIIKRKINRIVDVGQAFKGVNTECVVTILENTPVETNKATIEVMDTKGVIVWSNEIVQEGFYELPDTIFNIYLTEKDLVVIRKVLKQKRLLGDLVSIKRGMEIGKKSVRGSTGTIRTLLGEDVGKYQVTFGNTFVESDFEEVSRLLSHSDVDEKILIRRVCSDLTAALDVSHFFYTKNLYGLINRSDMSLKYLLGIINSKLMNFFFKKYFTTKKKDIFPEFQKYQLDKLPIRRIDFSDRSDRQRHEQMVHLVGQMIVCKRQLAEAQTDRDKTFYENKCAATNRQIESLVYELYEVDDSEIAIVEAS
ncbi:MAG TPA: TaqI-like C-terminal specificity domain-containing protein [Nitrososphaera sp.]|nr:TaqI-like C-terminal specificity domain-containing protein [Nitrososphaera sp.]